jgi:hypothetical protein
VPARWPEFLAGIKDKAERREVRRRGFRWPREHLYLSASGAHARAWLLRWFGATVDVEASDPVTWPEWQDISANGRDWQDGSTAARWQPPEEDPLAGVLLVYDEVARFARSAEPKLLTSAQTGEAMIDIYRDQAGFYAAYFGERK